MSLFLKDLRHLLIDTVNLIYPPTDPNQSAAQATATASSSSTAATTSSIDGLKDDASLTAAIDAASSYKHQQYRLMQKSGYLWKEGDVWKTWKCRYFVLSAQVLYYYVQREDTVAKGMILLDGCEVRESTRKPFAFEIYHQDDEKRRVYCLVASDEDAKQQWMKAIRNNIMYELNRNRCFLDEIDMWKAKAQELQETLNREHAQRQLESLNAESSVTKSAQPAAAPSSATSTSKEEASTPAASAPLDAVATTTNTPDDAQTSSPDAPHHRTTTSLYGSSLFDVPSGSAASLAVSSTAKSGPAPATAASLSRRTSQLDSTRRTSTTLVSNANTASYRFNATPISVWQAKLGVLEQENELLRDENERLKAYVLHHPARADEQGGGAASSTISAAAPSSNVPASTSNESPATNSSASSSLSSSSSSSSSSDLSTLSADELRSALTRAHEDCERYRNEVIMLKAQRKLLKQEVLRLTKEAGGGAAGATASS